MPRKQLGVGIIRCAQVVMGNRQSPIAHSMTSTTVLNYKMDKHSYLPPESEVILLTPLSLLLGISIESDVIDPINDDFGDGGDPNDGFFD